MLKKKTRGRWLWLSLLAFVPFSSAQAGTSGGTREGRAQGHDVHVDKATSTAWGALGTARLEPLPDPAGSDTFIEKAIGCYVDATVGLALVQCSAFNGQWLYCVSADPAMAAAVSAMNGDSRISFTVGAENTCIHLIVDNSSIYQQKAN